MAKKKHVNNDNPFENEVLQGVVEAIHDQFPPVDFLADGVEGDRFAFHESYDGRGYSTGSDLPYTYLDLTLDGQTLKVAIWVLGKNWRQPKDGRFTMQHTHTAKGRKAFDLGDPQSLDALLDHLAKNAVWLTVEKNGAYHPTKTTKPRRRSARKARRK